MKLRVTGHSWSESGLLQPEAERFGGSKFVILLLFPD
jgi:hypothetical protein